MRKHVCRAGTRWGKEQYLGEEGDNIGEGKNKQYNWGRARRGNITRGRRGWGESGNDLSATLRKCEEAVELSAQNMGYRSPRKPLLSTGRCCYIN